MNDDAEKNSSEDPIEELTNILNEAEKKGEEISEAGRHVTSQGQYMADLARAGKAVIPYLPPQAIENVIGDWRPYIQQAKRTLTGLRSTMTDTLPSTDSTAGTATLSIVRALPSVDTSVIVNPTVLDPQAISAIVNLQSVANRFTDANKTRNLLQTLGLDKARKGKRSPLHLFNTAHEAFERPVSNEDPVITSLIPMRECIRLVMDDLLKRSPGQVKTRNDYDKIISIGNRVKRDSVQMETIESLAYKWHHEIRDKDLSAAKEARIGREEWARRLTSATQFLFSLLSGLDPAKLKAR